MRRGDSASTFTKGLKVLACFQEGKASLTMAEIARLAGFDRAVTRRLCLSLVESGYLKKVDNYLSLTPKILTIAAGYLAANNVGRVAQPLLNQCAEDLGIEISLAVRDGHRAIYVAQSSLASSRISKGFTVGSTVPLLNTSIGRVLTASCPQDVIDEILDLHEPVKYTVTTELSTNKLRSLIAQTAAQGFAYVENEFEMGTAAIAVPIGKLGHNEAAIGTTAPINKIAPQDEKEKALSVLRQLAMALGQSPPFV